MKAVAAAWPDLLGVSPGAGLGAAVALLLGAGAVMVQGAAFAGGLAVAALALGAAGLARGADGLSLVLCGLVTGALALRRAGAGPRRTLFATARPHLVAAGLLHPRHPGRGRGRRPAGAGRRRRAAVAGFRLDVLSLGDEQARSLGLPASRLRMIAIAAATLMTSAVVAVSGVVGWIGLLAPHAARRIVGSEAGRLLPASMALGAVFALIIDRLSTWAGPAELPVGLLAAGVGAPAFLILFVVTARREP